MKLPVANADLAHALLQAETAFYTSRIASIGEKVGNPEGVEIRSFGDATAYYIRTMPWGLFNSIKGLTMKEIGLIDDVIAYYGDKQRVFQLDVDPVGINGETLRELARKGLCPTGFQSVLYGLPLPEPPPLPEGVAIREIDNDADFEVYAGIHCVGAGMDIAHKHHFASNNRGLLHRPGWRLFLASLNDVPAAVGVLHISGDIASLTLAATVPEFRQCGLQTALLRWRMHEAHKAGCKLVAGQAGVIPAEAGSSSQRNMERCGLRLAWTRTLWGPLQA